MKPSVAPDARPHARLCPGEAVDEREQPEGCRYSPRDVVSLAGCSAALNARGVSANTAARIAIGTFIAASNAIRHRVLGEDPSEDQADGRAATGYAAVDAESSGPLTRFGERTGHQ